MPGLVPGIHVFTVLQSTKRVDGRDLAFGRPGHDAECVALYESDRYAATFSPARRSTAMSSLFMRMSALITRFECAPSPLIISLSIDGTTCHDTPNWSLSQPQRPFSPPAESFSQNASISSWVSQATIIEIASENLNSGPPLSPMKRWPSSSKMTVSTVPFGSGPASP